MITPLVMCLTTHVILTLAAPPTLEDLIKIQCPPEKPNFCMPFGYCCGNDHFCHKIDGKCQKCFPLNVTEENLLAWCRDVGQHNVTLMQHHSCRLACQSRFSSSQLALVKQDCHVCDNVRLLVVSTLLGLSVVTIVVGGLYCFVKRYRQSLPRVKDNIKRANEEGEGNSLMSERNSEQFDLVLARSLSKESDIHDNNVNIPIDTEEVRKDQGEHYTNNPA